MSGSEIKPRITGIKVFSATMWQERQILGEKVTQWLEENAKTLKLVDMIIRQSSDDAFHCVSIVVFYRHVTQVQVAKPARVVAAGGGR